MNKKLLFAAFIIIILISIGVFLLVRGGVVPNQLNNIDRTENTEPPEPYVDPFPDDTDRDGISNAEEIELGLDTTEYDTDQDGLADALEINGTETDPTNPDSDGDGLSDGQEFLIWGTDPNNTDSDGDGFDDPSEIDNGYNPNGSGKLTF